MDFIRFGTSPKVEQNQYAIKLSAAELAANIFPFTIVEVVEAGGRRNLISSNALNYLPFPFLAPTPPPRLEFALSTVVSRFI